MRRLSHACVVFTMIAAAPAMARQPLPQPDDLAAQAIHNFGACIVRASPKAAATVLSLDFRTPAYRDRLHRLASGAADSCGAGFRLASGQLLVAGSIAESLLTMGATADRFGREVAYDPSKPPIAARNEEEMIGMCVARTAPKESWALLVSEPASDAETATTKALVPTLGNCVASGASVKLNRPALRAIVALGAYQLAHPAAASASASKES